MMYDDQRTQIIRKTCAYYQDAAFMAQPDFNRSIEWVKNSLPTLHRNDLQFIAKHCCVPYRLTSAHLRERILQNIIRRRGAYLRAEMI